MSKVKKAEPVVDQENNELLALALKNIQTDKQDLVEKMNTLLSQGKEKVKDSIVEALTQIDKSILETRDKKYVPKDFGKRRF